MSAEEELLNVLINA